MAVKIKTKYGLIDMSNNVIATVVGASATSTTALSAWLPRMLCAMASAKCSTVKTTAGA